MRTSWHEVRRRALTVLLALAITAGIALTPTVPAASEPGPESLCDTRWSDLTPMNPVENVRAGLLTTAGHDPVQVAVDGDVDWTLDPFHELTWRMWLDTLHWTGALIDSYDETGDEADLELALAYAHDYVRDQPMDANTPDEPFRQSTARRLHLFVCLYERAPREWLEEAIEGTVAFVEKNWQGINNHGQDQDLALLAAGCTLHERDWIDFARARMARTLAVSIDSQGATNEQATAYARYSWERWTLAAESLRRCGEPPLPTLADKLVRARNLVAFATLPNGHLIPIGDSFFRSKGVTGVKWLMPSGAWTSAGFAFGRSSWAEDSNPSIYSLRFGPRRQIHGNNDHGGVTLYANGSHVITDTGSVGYAHASYPWFQRSRFAENVLVVGDGTCDLDQTSVLRSQQRTATSDAYVVETPECGKLVASRKLTYNRTTRTMGVADWTNVVKKSRTYQQLWHLLADTKASVTSLSAYSKKVVLTMPNGSKATMTIKSVSRIPFTVGVVKGRTSPMQGWISGGVGQADPAPVVVVTQTGRSANLQTSITWG
jgi:hypothetical protein